jgi:hypothetical protein
MELIDFYLELLPMLLTEAPSLRPPRSMARE